MDSEKRVLEELGRTFAEAHWSSAVLEWPTSNAYRNYRNVWYMMFGRFTVEESLREDEIVAVMKAAHRRESEIGKEKGAVS